MRVRAGLARFGDEWKSVPQQPGMNLEQMAAAGRGPARVQALFVVGQLDPLARFNIDPFALAETFVVVEDLFLTETADVAEVVLRQPVRMKNPAASPIPAATCNCCARPAIARA